MSKEEIELIEKFFEFRAEKWKEYIDMVDPLNSKGETELNVNTTELMRTAFVTGIWLGIGYTYKDLEGDNK